MLREGRPATVRRACSRLSAAAQACFGVCAQHVDYHVGLMACTCFRCCQSLHVVVVAVTALSCSAVADGEISTQATTRVTATSAFRCAPVQHVRISIWHVHIPIRHVHIPIRQVLCILLRHLPAFHRQDGPVYFHPRHLHIPAQRPGDRRPPRPSRAPRADPPAWHRRPRISPIILQTSRARARKTTSALRAGHGVRFTVPGKI